MGDFLGAAVTKWISIRRAACIPAAFHLGLCVCIGSGLLRAEESWSWFPVFFLDFPFSVALMPMVNAADPTIVFGVFGTAWWYLVSFVIMYSFKRLLAPARKGLSLLNRSHS